MRPGRYLKYQYYKMVRVKDTPGKVAQGVGLGFALDVAIPIPFVSIFIAFVVAKIFRMNSIAAVMSATALKPFFPAFIYINLAIKSYIVALFPALGTIILPHAEGTNFMGNLINSILAGGVPYLLAGVFNGLAVFLITYTVIYYSIKARVRRIKMKKAKTPV